MNVLIGNQKGGVGKSTLCILLANYLTLLHKEDCLILDMDFQSSIHWLWEKDRANYDNTPLYEVLVMEMEKFNQVKEQIRNTSGHVLIDLPGKMDDNQLIPVYQSADLVICPFAYDKITFESTVTFAQVVRHLNKKAVIAFIPNRLKAGVRYDIRTQVNKILGSFGEVMPELPDRVAFQRLDTVSIPEELAGVLKQSFDPLYEKYLNTAT
ncbi:MAG: ParA family protein [Cyclobacteriaceae bacterium]|nr:ParA family protein [Cyclobacteriaceae bacterium]